MSLHRREEDSYRKHQYSYTGQRTIDQSKYTVGRVSFLTPIVRFECKVEPLSVNKV